MLEWVPLCRVCHQRYHDGDEWVGGMVKEAAASYHRQVKRHTNAELW